jgi:hypothetical protein
MEVTKRKLDDNRTLRISTILFQDSGHIFIFNADTTRV